MNVLWNELIKKNQNSALIAEKFPYGIKYAESREEILACQKLRYRVFQQEQGKCGGNSSEKIDQDAFDEKAVHLLVYKETPQRVVGTYRFIHAADRVSGMYSAGEFNISGLDGLLSKTMEVGRSCVDPACRDGSAVALLWAGIADAMRRSGMRYLIGCASLEDTRASAAVALYRHFCRLNLLDTQVHAEPAADYRLNEYDETEVETIQKDSSALREIFPPLLKGYMRLGAKICGPPAFDREFGTIDFLILLDVARLPDRYSRHFNIKIEA
ncbi:MAG: GNAT family N-acetyltransferase [Lentisphaeria bacterium]|nr:GNAT family N-acetyltransferase [Lentisphaeria bacterium]